ncbi:hypothetical protein HNQ51_000222 [Inhella inkyongensis]|uniref:Histidine kinase domain-containing protein n=1 Tax=Inhella inkyongensis TaxID=392593 RepID=A0A840S308_9BURK|nr:histidine kinase [Inhella inkyongensis]MBB5202929.1 hypothetical protein [Inhella inkyongensis]
MKLARAALLALLAWVPVGLLFTLLMVGVHGLALPAALLVALRLTASAALLGWLAFRLCARWPWPHPMRLGFVLRHLLTACAYGLAWVALNWLLESAWKGRVWSLQPGLALAMGVTGFWLYAIVAGIAYAQGAAARAAELQALQARSELAALRAQLQPHFLFNALHTVVQLIPLDPARAVDAAQELAALLRASCDATAERRSLGEEWALVQRYLTLERLRFGERLIVDAQFDPDSLARELPAFALQTLVENAVRHGAAPRVAPTTLTLRAHTHGEGLRLSLQDDGVGCEPEALSGGSGLRRLRERLSLLYGEAARLELQAVPGQGVRVSLEIP